jgi:hypothetical protein
MLGVTSIASRMPRALPATSQTPEFTDYASILAFAREVGRLPLTADVDMRRLAEARGAAALALSAHQGHTQQQLVDALLRLEHGGAAYALLAGLQEGLDAAPRRPLPGRIVRVSPVGVRWTIQGSSAARRCARGWCIRPRAHTPATSYDACVRRTAAIIERPRRSMASRPS